MSYFKEKTTNILYHPDKILKKLAELAEEEEILKVGQRSWRRMAREWCHRRQGGELLQGDPERIGKRRT